MSLQVTEGFSLLSLSDVVSDAQTYYKRIEADGSSDRNSNAVPLVVVHGGPLLGHNYCLPLQQLAHDPKVSAVVFYDQLGCGKSTHVSKDNENYVNGFWDVNVRQLKALLDDLGLTTTGFHLFGHSMGSLLALSYAATHPEGLKALIVANAIASFADARKANLQLLENFPAEVSDSIIGFEEHCLGKRKEALIPLEKYLWASDTFRAKHFDRVPPPISEDFEKSNQNIMEVVDIFAALCGGTVRFLWGSPIADYSAEAVLHKISTPTLVVKGEFDQCLSSCQEPILQLVPQARDITLEGASHMTTEEVPGELMAAIARFLADL